MTEKEREALMRLTMCARNECVMCKYKDSCDSDVRFEFATKHMNILADALRKTENSSEIPNNWEDFFREPTAEERKAVADYIDSISVPTGVNVFDFMTEPTISKMEQVETMSCQECKHWDVYKGCRERVCNYEPKDEPQTETSTNSEKVQLKVQLTDEPQTDCPWK